MTDERKPETPGMSEVSPKFVDEGEAAVEAAAAQKAHDTIEAVLNKLPPQGEDETQIEGVYRKVLALRENHPPRGCTDQDMAAWVDKHDGLEEAIGKLRTENFRDVEIKVAVLRDRLRENLPIDEPPANVDFTIAQSALDGLRCIAETSGVAKVAQPDTALAALWEEWQRLWEANKKAVEEAQDDKLAGEIFSTLIAVEKSMEVKPARSVAGALLKLRVVSVWVDNERDETFEGEMGMMWRLTLSALADLNRLAVQAPVTMPEVEDPVLVLKREWDVRRERYKSEPNRADEEIIGPLHDRLIEAEFAIYSTPATTPEGIAIKLRMWGRNHPDPDRGENWCEPPVKDIEGNLDDMPILSVLRDLERMSQGVAAPHAPAVPVINEPLLALERRWREAEKALEEEKTDWRPVAKVQDEIIATPARSIAGVLVKLRVYGDLEQEDAGVPKIDQMPLSELEGAQAAVVGAMRDLERLVGEDMPIPGSSSPQHSPIFSQVFDMETPITDAEGAVEALWLLVEDGKLCPDAAEPIAYLVSHLNGHIQEQRRLFDELFVAAGGSAA